MTILTFNNLALIPVSQNDNQVWLNSSQLSQAIGYKNVRSLNKLFNANSDEFTESMTRLIDTTDSVVSGENKGLRAKTRIFSLRGCHLIAMFARTNQAKQFRKWVLDVLDNEVGEITITPTDALSQQSDRRGLTRAVRNASSYFEIEVQRIWKLIHQRFNVNHSNELSLSQVGEAVEYLHNLMLNGKSRYLSRATDNLESDTAIYGEEHTVVGQVMTSGKFVGTFDESGRMVMRELRSDEFVTTYDKLPDVIHDHYPHNINTLSQIAIVANQAIARETFTLASITNAKEAL